MTTSDWITLVLNPLFWGVVAFVSMRIMLTGEWPWQWRRKGKKPPSDR